MRAIGLKIDFQRSAHTKLLIKFGLITKTPVVGKGLKLASHLTHLLQPLDVGVFKPLKSLWCAAVADFTRREHRTLAKRDFPEILSGIWKKYNPDTARGGFKGCGIYPFDNTILSPHSTKYSEPFGSYSRLLMITISMQK